ncbi:MAG: phosphoribosylglycinamide formyltransferase [Planctomycetota bacterium]
MADPIRVVALISGSGRTVSNLLDVIEAGGLDATLDLVVASRPDATGLQRARLRGVETAVVASAAYRSGGAIDWAAMSAAVDALVLPRAPDLVILAGYMCLYVVPDALAGKVLNIHPALLPAFGGRGMWGHHVHEAVVASGVKVTGCTVHFATNHYDAGPIILQRTCPVRHTDTADDVADRVFALECEAYPAAVRLFAAGKLRIRGGVVEVKD